MALISGTGTLFVNNSKVHDIRFENEGGLVMDGGFGAEVRGCHFEIFDGNTALSNAPSGALLVTECTFEGDCLAIASTGASSFMTITDNNFFQPIRAIVTTGVTNQNIVIANNRFFVTEEVAIDLNGVQQVVIEGNVFLGCATELSNTEAIIDIDGSSVQVTVADNVFQDILATPAVRSLADQTAIVGNTLQGSDNGEPAHAIVLSSVRGFVVADNLLNDAANGATGGHGIQIVDCSDGVVKGNQLRNVSLDAANTYDFINVTTSNRVLIIGNHLDPELDVGQIRYGINIVSGSNNAVYANFLGDSSDYGTADSANTATATQTSPAAGAIGGQFAF